MMTKKIPSRLLMVKLGVAVCVLFVMTGCLKDSKKAKVNPGANGHTPDQQKPIQEQGEGAALMLLYELADMVDQFHLTFLIHQKRNLGCAKVLSVNEGDSIDKYIVNFTKCPLLKGYLNAKRTFSLEKRKDNLSKIHYSSATITSDRSELDHPNLKKKTRWVEVSSNFKLIHQKSLKPLIDADKRFYLDYSVRGEGTTGSNQAKWEHKVQGYFLMPDGDPVTTSPIFQIEEGVLTLNRMDIRKKRAKGKEEKHQSLIQCEITPASQISFALEPCTRPIGQFRIKCIQEEKKKSFFVELESFEDGYMIQGNPNKTTWVCP